MKKKEVILLAIVVIILAAVLIVMNVIGAKSTSKKLVITVDGAEYRTIELTDQTNMQFTIETPDGYNDVVITNGVVDVVAADCRNQVCVNTKSAQNVFDKIVCLPHKVILEIVDGGN